MDSSKELQQLERETQAGLEQAKSLPDLAEIKRRVLGRQGILRGWTARLANLPDSERSSLGKRLNEMKLALEAAFTQRQQVLEVESASWRTEPAFFDVSFPGERPSLGTAHPIPETMQEICRIFGRLGFSTTYGPEIETTFYNFEALNTPLEHPSAEPTDTYYLDLPPLEAKPTGPEGAEGTRTMRPTGQTKPARERFVLRTHTSPGQVRVMVSRKPPLRVVIPGKVFRPDTPDATHLPMFHQVEGLMVAGEVSFADLKGALALFLREFFRRSDLQTKFRPHFFPFTEPSAEVEIACLRCDARGCSACGGGGWLEVMGCGMVHPRVFQHVGYDPEECTGFAFGMGVERMAMLRHRVWDLRLFTENHLRFLSQFR